MIPKKLHYVGVGGSPIPNRVQEIMNNAQKVLGPKGIIKVGTENDFDINSNPFTKYGYERKNGAFVSDYIRAYVVNKEGGWYTDTDIGLNKSLDSFLKHDYVASRTYVTEHTMSIFGSTKGNKVLQTYMNTICHPKLISKPPRIMSTHIHTYALRKHFDIVDDNVNQESKELLILKENILQIKTNDENVAIHEHHDNGTGKSDMSVSKYYDKKIKSFNNMNQSKLKKLISQRDRIIIKIDKLTR